MDSKASGEGVAPEVLNGEAAVEHVHRYLFAREFVAGRRVLDIGCRDGAGPALLASAAAQVTAVMAGAEQARIAAAGQGAPNLEFLVGAARRLPLPDAGVEVALALDGLGPEPEAALAELRRVLRPGGLLLAAASAEEEGFADRLRERFAHVAVAGQGPVRGSGLYFGEAAAGRHGFAWNCPGLRAPDAPAGRLAIASDAELPPLFDAVCTAPAPSAEARIEALLEELDRLRDNVAEQEGRVRAASARIEMERQRANAIERSTIWRASQPLRRFLSRYPRLRQTIREGLRRLYRSRHTLRHRRVRRQRQQGFSPLVSVVVPNFNHARFLPQRLDSILGQTYRNLEVIVLDDASTDDSLAVIERYRAAHPEVIRVIANAENSGGVFRQWRRGFESAKGELVWICESDDFAEKDFLEALVPAFLDESVMIGFGRVQFADQAGKPYPGLDAYRERSQPGIWKAASVRPAKAWFDTGFGVHNVIPNVGGCLLRNQPVEAAVWEEAASYRILGDWCLYARLARGGRLAYEPEAVSYFRQHEGNTSVSGFSTPAYYEEHERLIRLLRALWGVPEETVRRFADELRDQYARSASALGPMEQVFDEARVLAVPRSGRHVLMVLLGFYLGGGEIFPIHLANELVRQGITVSVLALQPHDWIEGVRAMLDRRVAVYDAELVRRQGPVRFLAETGVDVIHSHFVSGEHLFLNGREVADLPYVASMHGAYEVTAIDADFVRTVARQVDLWVYLTEKNLDHLRVLDEAERAQVQTLRLPNGMPVDPRPFGRSREELGIGAGDLAFALVSRAIPEKGWEAALEALAQAQARTDRRLHLLLCGEGPEADRLRALHAGRPGVAFLGFQDRVHGLYRLADVALLPTRFQGESFPLSLVQAMQVGRPSISTDLGEIARMLVRDGRRAGIVLPPDPEDGRFVAALAEAMLRMADDATRAGFARDAEALGQAYGMEQVAAGYLAGYEMAIARRRSRGAPQSGPALRAGGEVPTPPA